MQLDVVTTVQQFMREGRFTAALTDCDKALEGDCPKLHRFALLQLKAQILVATDGKWTGLQCLA